MGVKKLKPITPGQRFRVVNDFEQVTAAKPEKSLVIGKSKSGGRNNQGRMTMRYVGGGHKQKVRVVDFKRDKAGVPATVKAIEYDPLRSAYLMLLVYADGEKRYSIAVNGVSVGDTLMSGADAAPEIGNALFLGDIPLGTIVSNIEMRPGQGAIIARSAGTFAQLVAREGKYAIVKLPSGETRMILTTCIATIGTVSNSEHMLQVSGKAGRSRWQGRRPRVRGVVMNLLITQWVVVKVVRLGVILAHVMEFLRRGIRLVRRRRLRTSISSNVERNNLIVYGTFA